VSPVRRIRRIRRGLARRRAARSGILQPIAVLWLVVLWILLWGRVTPGLLATGLVIGTVTIAMFPLPPLAIDGRIRPFAALRFGLRFVYDLVRASLEVASLAFRRDQEAPTAVIGVPLVTRSDLMLTLVAEVLSLVPGSLVVEIDRHDAIIYLHLIGVRDRDEVERERRRASETEARMIRAFGSPVDRAALEARGGSGTPSGPAALASAPGPAPRGSSGPGPRPEGAGR
jgi:multicomponent Na+:H+ antiporter subunit E